MGVREYKCIMMELKELLDKVGFEPNKGQRLMLEHKGSPLNGLSCAGSGKTTTINNKLLKMQLVDGVSPDRIVALTFSKMGAEDMKSKHIELCKKIGIKSTIKIKTFHAFYLELIKEFKPSVRVIDEGKRTMLLSNIIKSTIRARHEKTLEDVSSLLSYCLNNMLFTPQQIVSTPKFVTSNISLAELNETAEKYNRAKRGDMDFDDLQLRLYEKLSTDEAFREKISSRADYYVIDEYQDVSKIQLEILKLIIKDTNNLITIGDDDQCIYEWRGSTIDYIVHMPLHFKGTTKVVMDVNYRCPENILRPIVNSIQRNKNRIDKTMRASRPGGVVDIIPCETELDCSREIVKDIVARKESGELNRFNSMESAILYRNHNQALFVSDMLMRKGIPVQAKSDDSLLSNHYIVKDMIAATELVLMPTRADLFLKVANKFFRNLGNYEVNNIAKNMCSYKPWYACLPRHLADDFTFKTTVERFKHAVEDIKTGKCYSEVLSVLYMLYKDYIQMLSMMFKLEYSALESIVLYLIELCREDQLTFDDFLYHKDSTVSKNKYNKENNIGVKIMTMHSCKGLEFDTVYLLNDSSKHCPSEKISNQILKQFGPAEYNNYIEQERRLHYVAWTRPRERLVVTYEQENPSMFLRETGLISN